MAAAKSAIGKDMYELEPVKPADPNVIEVGQFAVKEHNKQAGTELLFVGVVGGFWWAPVGATHYWLIIETQDPNGATYLQKAYVIVIPGTTMELKWYKN